jgi:hypothetical protein
MLEDSELLSIKSRGRGLSTSQRIPVQSKAAVHVIAAFSLAFYIKIL